MSRSKLGVVLFAAAVVVFLLPVTAYAQSAIAGTVKDTSGAVLPA
jgi:hypothetical protein